jgi:peptidoglycan/xylan/chitin deacetylase (PgdA/CDA1 family)
MKMEDTQGRTFKKAIVKILDRLNIAEAKIRLLRRDIILVYHSVESEKSGYPYSVSKESFREHASFLMSKFKLVSLEEMFNSPETRISRAALTFDDAYEDFYTDVYPILVSMNIPATVFVPTLFLEGCSRPLEQEELGYSKEHLSRSQMKEMSASGLVRLESHSHSHRNYVAGIDTLKKDVELSMHLLEKNLGRRPRYFAYSFGIFNAETDEILLDCGFEKLLTVESTRVKGKSVEGRLGISRRNESMDYFKLTVAGINGNYIRSLWACLSGRYKS